LQHRRNQPSDSVARPLAISRAVRALATSTIALILAAASASAQTIRGTVVDADTKLPIFAASVTLVDDSGAEVSPSARSDSLGNFIVHAARAGMWRVKAMRIGYGPVTSDPVSLPIGGLAVVRLQMTTVAQRLLPVQVVEQRQLSANELMSTSGFDLRQRRGLGRFLSGERLASMGHDGLREVLATQFQPVLYVYADSVLGDVLRIRQGSMQCEPEVYLDGRLLATAPTTGAVMDGTTPQTALDSMRARMRRESERTRVGADQMYALTVLSALAAIDLHGIEVYRSNEIPPTSLGAWFGMTQAAIRACGSVAVWTKKGAQSIVAARNNAAVASRALQVINGTLTDYDTGAPLAGRTVTLLDEARDPIGSAVVTDERGDFTIRTARAGELRLRAGGSDYLVSTTPVFRVAANELVIVKLFVSGRRGVLAPIGVASRVLPQHISVTSLAGFTYRRERAQGGSFFRAVDIERTNVASLTDLTKSVAGMPAACAPTYYLDGTRLGEQSQARLASLPLSSVFGVEIYTRPADFPELFTDTNTCALVIVWTKR
jgi:hypothetical protein